MIASRPRCGTHLLSTALDGLADVTCYLEPFNPEQLSWEPAQRTIPQMWDQSLRPKDWLTRCRLKAGRHSTAFGFCLHAYQFDELPSVATQVQQLDPRVIIIRREDLLAQFVSFQIATDTSSWWNAKDDLPSTEVSRPQIEVEPDQFLEYCRKIRLSVKRDRETWAHRPTFEITYEQLVADYETQMRLATAFVGGNVWPESGFPTKTARVENRSMTEVVLNYADLATACESSDFSDLFTQRDSYERKVVSV